MEGKQQDRKANAHQHGKLERHDQGGEQSEQHHHSRDSAGLPDGADGVEVQRAKTDHDQQTSQGRHGDQLDQVGEQQHGDGDKHTGQEVSPATWLRRRPPSPSPKATRHSASP